MYCNDYPLWSSNAELRNALNAIHKIALRNSLAL